MMYQVVIVLLFATLFAGTAIAVQSANKSAQRQRMLAVITKNSGLAVKVGGADKEKQLARQRAELARKLKEAGAEHTRKKKTTTMRQTLQQAGLDIPVSRFFMVSAGFAALVWVALSLTKYALVTKLCITLTAFLGVPRLVIRRMAGRRQRKFLEDFADALEAMVRLLQSGMPVTEAIAMVSREYQGPIKEEMTGIYEDQKVGISLGDAAERAAKRMPITEVKMFAAALQIQSETGSSLSEVLTNLANVIRARFRLQRKVKALSSEAKASASIIGSLPILVATALYFVNPDYIMLLFTTKMGKILSSGAGFWMTCGILVMKKMINFRV